MKLYFKIDKTVMVFSLIVTIYCIVQILSYTGIFLSGNYKWLFMPSDYFGIPHMLKETYSLSSFLPKGSAHLAGWDGQFYYYISNDILGMNDFADFVDNPSYRWQRIGVPLFAKILSLVTLHSGVSVFMYLFANILLIFIATYVFSAYLKDKGLSIFWVLPWVLCSGLQVAMRHGLVDAGGDAFFIIAFIFMLRKQYLIYMIAMTMACLSRESYVLLAFMFFIFLFFGKLDNRYNYKNIRQLFIFAVPGINFVLWYAYVSYRFCNIPAAGVGGRITDLFLASFFKYFFIAINNHNTIEICSLFIYIFMIFFVLYVSFRAGFEKIIFWAFVPYTLLLGSFGPTVMSHHSGYMKAIASLFAIIPFFIIHGGGINNYIKKFLIIFLGVATIFSVLVTFKVPRGYGDKYPLGIFYTNQYDRDERGETLTNTDSSIEVIECQKNLYTNIPFSGIFTEDYLVCDVRIENKSGKTWNKGPSGLNTVYLSYFIYDQVGNKVADGVRSVLPRDILTNQNDTSLMYIILPKENGHYKIRISLVQEGVIWFFQNNNGFVDMDISIE